MGWLARSFAVVACVGLCACSPLTPRQAQKPSAVYTLDEVGKITHSERPLCGGITIDTVRAAPGYGTARMIYSRNPHQLEAFAYHKWADSPANMLQSLLVSALEKSGRFGSVLTRSAAEPAKLRMAAEIVELNQQFTDGDSKLILQVRVHLFDNEQVLGTRLFQVEEGAGSGPETGVTAANHAAARFTEELVGWMDETLGKNRASCQ